MRGSLRGWQVGAGEQRVLHVVALYATGLARPAKTTPQPDPGRGSAGQAVLVKLLVLAPPVLAKQRPANRFSRAAPGHGCIPPGWPSPGYWYRLAAERGPVA